MLNLSAVQSPSVIQACSAIQACSGITVIPAVEEDEEVVAFTNTYSVDFDGTDDYATIADANDLSFGNASTDSAFSIMAWVKMDDATKFRIVSKTNSTSDAEWFFTTSGSDKLRIDLLDADNNNRIGIETSAAITAHEGSWIHVIATYDGGGDSSTMVLYINGVAQATSATDAGSYTAMHNTNAPVWIGGLAYGPDFANGKIDEVAIIPSELSAAQALAIYNSGEPADLTSYSPTVWTRFEEGTGTSIADSSGNGHTATLTNGPTFSTDVPGVTPFTNTYSVDFDNSDDYIDLTAFNPSTQIGSGDITISVWVKLDSIAGYDTVASLTYYNASAEKSIKIQFLPGLGFRVQFANSGAFTNIYSTATIAANTWYHVIATRTGTTGNIWVNNADNGTNTHSNIGTDLSGATWHALGLYHAAATPDMGGLIHDYAIFDRVISSDERAELYNNGVSIDAREVTGADPVAYYPLNEGTSTVATDLISANNGTLTNGPTWSTDVPT